MPANARSCGSCGTELPVGARFCASCGARVAPVGGPVSWSVAERRYFGIVPGARIVAVVRSRLARWWAISRSRIRLALAVVHSRAVAGVARMRLKREARLLESERAGTLQALGDAVYRDDPDQTARSRRRVGELERRLETVNDELEHIDRREGAQIARARLEGGPTNIVEPPSEPPEPGPGPPIVPEPEPVPHEPPGPVIVPEPEPVPHEPPGPVIVPEPEPPQPGS